MEHDLIVKESHLGGTQFPLLLPGSTKTFVHRQQRLNKPVTVNQAAKSSTVSSIDQIQHMSPKMYLRIVHGTTLQHWWENLVWVWQHGESIISTFPASFLFAPRWFGGIEVAVGHLKIAWSTGVLHATISQGCLVARTLLCDMDM